MLAEASDKTKWYRENENIANYATSNGRSKQKPKMKMPPVTPKVTATRKESKARRFSNKTSLQTQNENDKSASHDAPRKAQG